MKKILAGCLCFVMILCMVPTVQAKAQNNEHSHAICGNSNCTEDHNNDGVSESHVNEVWQAWDGTDKDLATEGIQLTEGKWYLEGNISPSNTINIVGEVSLCLNGMVINGANHSERVIVVQEGATLTLCDCQDTEHKFTPNGDGKWVLDEVSGTKAVSGGVITASTFWSGGAIDCVGNLNMYGGNIVGNHARMYGAITVNSGLLNMYGGTICGNTGCSAIHVWHWGAQSNIHGGKIYENRIEEGAVYVTGSSILGISGNLEIYDNTTGTEKKNLVKDWSCTVKLVGELYNTKPIGINCSDGDVFIEADGNNVNDLTEYLDCFVSDDSMKVLFLTTDNKGIEIDYYGVAVQPSIDNNYTVTVNYPEGVKYQWYTGIIIPVTTENGSEFSDNNSASSYDQNTGEWSYETTVRDTRTVTYISDVTLSAGDVLKITLSGSAGHYDIYNMSIESGEDKIVEDQSENGVYTFKVKKDGTYTINMDVMNAMGSKPSIKAEIITVENILSGQTSERMNTATLDDGKYICKVTWDKGTIDTSDDSIALSDIVEYEKPETTPIITAPSITTQPVNASIKVGETATFAITATGTDLTYQWQIDRNDGNGFVNITNATSASYTTLTVTKDCDGFKYQCIVSNSAGTVKSNVVMLTVTEQEHVHDYAEATCTVPKTCKGCGVTEGTALGHTADTAWEKDADNHWHTCSVSGCGAVIESTKAAHTYGDDNKCDICEYEKPETTPIVTAPIITTQPENASIKVGETAAFAITVTGTDLTYQWQIDRNDGNGFVNITNATSASYTSSTVTKDRDGFKYQCIVSNSAGTVKSDVVTLTVTEQEPATETPAPSYTILEGKDESWTQGTTETVTVRADGEFAKFTGVKVNDTLIDAKNYTAVSGSTVVTLKEEYLKTLEAGTYKLTIVFTDGACSTNFVVEKAIQDNPVPPTEPQNPDETSPKTGEIIGFEVLGIFALLGMCVVLKKKSRA